MAHPLQADHRHGRGVEVAGAEIPKVLLGLSITQPGDRGEGGVAKTARAARW